VLTPLTPSPFRAGTIVARAAFYKVRSARAAFRETAHRFRVNGITMNKKIQSVGSAGCGATGVSRSPALNRMP